MKFTICLRKLIDRFIEVKQLRPSTKRAMSLQTHLSIIPAISVCVCVSVSVSVSVTAVSRQPLVRSNWNLPGILLRTWVCAFSRFDINRTSGSQVMAIYVPNQWQDTVLWRHNWRHNSSAFFFSCCTYGHARTGTHVWACTSFLKFRNIPQWHWKL